MNGVSEQLFEESKKYIPGGVNSPVRAFGSVGRSPIFIKKAKGSRIFDEDGREYIDYVCLWGPGILGHAKLEGKTAGLVQAARETFGNHVCVNQIGLLMSIFFHRQAGG